MVSAQVGETRFQFFTMKVGGLYGRRPLRKEEAYRQEVAVLERLGKTMWRLRRRRRLGARGCRHHFPTLLAKNESNLTIVTTFEGEALDTDNGTRLLCEMAPAEILHQAGCIAKTLRAARVGHHDLETLQPGKNILVQKTPAGVFLALYDFDISTIDGFYGRGAKPASSCGAATRPSPVKYLLGLYEQTCQKDWLQASSKEQLADLVRALVEGV